MKAITFSNAKGGCGKTTCTIEVATVFKNMGYRVLVIDLDMQMSLSRCVNADTYGKNILDALTGVEQIKDCIQSLELFDIIPATTQLANADKLFTDPEEDRFLLSDVCEFLQDDYDYIFIDTAPARNILHRMTFTAVNYVVIPTRYDRGSIDATFIQQNEIYNLNKSRAGHYDCKIIGYVLSEFDRTNLSAISYDTVCEIAQNDNAFVTSVSHAVKVAEMKTYYSAVSKEAKSSKSGREFYLLADMILKKAGE